MRDKIKNIIKDKPLGYEVDLEAIVDVIEEFSAEVAEDIMDRIEDGGNKPVYTWMEGKDLPVALGYYIRKVYLNGKGLLPDKKG